MHHPTDRITHTKAFVTPVGITYMVTLTAKHAYSHSIVDPKQGFNYFFVPGMLYITYVFSVS